MSSLYGPHEFGCGPFVSSSINAQNFVYSVYYSMLFQESLKAQKNMENELNLAIERGEDVQEKQREMDFFESLFKLSLAIPADDEIQ